MTNDTPPTEEHARAFQLIGELFYWFSDVEREIDRGIAILLSLNPELATIVAANMDFGRKIRALRAAVTHTSATPPHQTRIDLRSLWSGLRELADDRNMAAHSPFEPTVEGGVVFTRAVADHMLQVSRVAWEPKDFHEWFGRAISVAEQLRQVVDTIVPYEPSLDFGDERNSALIAIL